MKSLTSFGALVRGAMIGLALNLSLAPMVQAQQASTPRPIEPAAIVPVVPPDVIVVPTDPVTQILSVQEEVYNALFTNAWNMLSSGFQLDEEVKGPGVVPGRSELNEPYELDAVIVGVASPDMLPAAERALVEAAGVRAAGVIGFLRSAKAEIACVGMALTINTEEGLRREFIPVRVLRGDDALALLAPVRAAGVGTQPDPGDGPTGIDGPVGPFDGPEWTEECLGCYRDYVREADAARREYDRAIESANAEYTEAVNTARTEYNNSVHLASVALTAALATAAIGLAIAAARCAPAAATPITLAICLAVAAAISAAAVAAAYIIYRGAIAAAQNRFAATVANAAATLSRKTNEAIGRYSDRLFSLERQLNDCLLLHDCPRIVEELP